MSEIHVESRMAPLDDEAQLAHALAIFPPGSSLGEDLDNLGLAWQYYIPTYREAAFNQICASVVHEAERILQSA